MPLGPSLVDPLSSGLFLNCKIPDLAPPATVDNLRYDTEDHWPPIITDVTQLDCSQQFLKVRTVKQTQMRILTKML